MADDLIEHYIGLSLAKVLEDSGISSTVQVQGFLAPVGDEVEDWLALDVLSIRRRRSRRKDWVGSVVFQVECISRQATLRADGCANAPWEIAARVRNLLEAAIPIKAYGTSSEEQIATLTVMNGEPEYRADSGEAPRGIHSVVLTFTGTAVKKNS